MGLCQVGLPQNRIIVGVVIFLSSITQHLVLDFDELLDTG